MDFDTICVHGENISLDYTGSVSAPIYMSSTFAHLGIGKSTGYDYSRDKNPTREILEKTMADLEQGTDALAFSSGMAAITCVMELFDKDDNIIVSDDLYGGTIRFFRIISEKKGLTFTAIDTSDINLVNDKINENTKAIFIETPTNPMMNVSDLEAISILAKKHKIMVIVDNTFLTPYFQTPLLLGADIIVHSGTKYLNGHNDVLAGFAVVKDEFLSKKLRELYKTIGACLSPFDSWLLLRGIKTLPLRMKKHEENAVILAKWLKEQKNVTKVYYPGLESHPQYGLSKKQSKGFGGMISFEVDTEETARKVIENVKLILFAESLGGTESLITYPILQTHADVPKEECYEKGLNERLLRMSVGIENIDDLINDLENAFK